MSARRDAQRNVAAWVKEANARIASARKRANRVQRAARNPTQTKNAETELQEAIIARLRVMPQVVVVHVSPFTFGARARAAYDANIARIERKIERGPVVSVERVNSLAPKADNSERRIRTSKPGTFDLGFVVAPWGVAGQWEIKTPDGGDLNDNQRVNLRWLRATGQIHGELRSVEDAEAAVTEAIGMCRARFGDLED